MLYEKLQKELLKAMFNDTRLCWAVIDGYMYISDIDCCMIYKIPEKEYMLRNPSNPPAKNMRSFAVDAIDRRNNLVDDYERIEPTGLQRKQSKTITTAEYKAVNTDRKIYLNPDKLKYFGGKYTQVDLYINQNEKDPFIYICENGDCVGVLLPVKV